VVNDEKSNGERLLWEELELREAMLKFRGPGTGDSEGGIVEEEGWVPVGKIMSFSVEKDWLVRDGELRRHPLWLYVFRV
jgi:hypothetical protein